MNQPQDAINGRLYGRNLVPAHEPNRLIPRNELAFVARYQSDLISKRVLDLGCGTARLARRLLSLTPDYLGIDISPHMVAYCRKYHPGGRFEQGDMRSLEACYGTIDTVIATGNLLDSVSHADRLHVLTEIHRTLVPGGLVAFSSHNRMWAEIGAAPHLERADTAIGQLRCVGQYVVASVNHLRIRQFERSTQEYALLNDSGHNHAVLNYYIDRDMQARQLAAAGFTLIETIDMQGDTLAPGVDDSSSSSLLYVARR